MGNNAKVGKQSKNLNILVAGQLGYHEINITQPIIDQLQLMGHHVERLGGNWDFFVPSNYPNIIDNWVSSVPKTLKGIDIVFFIDYWNTILPIFDYLRSITNIGCKFIGLVHGSINLENDVANMILGAKQYEKYMLCLYDTLIVHDKWLKKLLGNLSNIEVAHYPYIVQFSRERPRLSHRKRVIFAHRFESDKGKDDFLDFVDFCHHEDIEFVVTDTHKPINGVTFVGRLSQYDLKVLASGGGYAWSSVKSEIAHYAIMDLVSYGLTPLLNDHLAYHYFPDECKHYNNWDRALGIINSAYLFSNDNWDRLRKKLNHVEDIAKVIIGG